MKKIKFSSLLPYRFLAVIMAVTFMWGCQKKDQTIEVQTKNLKTPSCTEAQPTSATVLELMDNPDDVDDTRMNHILYHYANAMRNTMADPTKRCQLVNAMIALDGNGEISLFEYAAENVAFGNDLNAQIQQSISENEVYPKGVEDGIDALLENPSWDANTYLRNKFKYEEIDYDPIAHFVKTPEVCNTSNSVVIVIGTDVNDCDDVAGWRGNTEILMGEGEASTSAEIVIFVGVGERGNPQASSLIDVEDSPHFVNLFDTSVADRSYIDIDTDQFRIKKRFDKSKRSEILGYRTRFDPNVNNIWYSGIAGSFNPYKVHKNDIGANGKMHNDDKNWDNTLPSIFWSIQYGAFEKDWYATLKRLDNTCVTHDEYDMSGKRKYSSDLYFNDCTITAFDWFPSVGSTKVFSNNKCYFKLIRKP